MDGLAQCRCGLVLRDAVPRAAAAAAAAELGRIPLGPRPGPCPSLFRMGPPLRGAPRSSGHGAGTGCGMGDCSVGEGL